MSGKCWDARNMCRGVCDGGVGREPGLWLDAVGSFHFRLLFLLFLPRHVSPPNAKARAVWPIHPWPFIQTNPGLHYGQEATVQLPQKVLTAHLRAPFQQAGRGFCHMALESWPYWDLREKIRIVLSKFQACASVSYREDISFRFFRVCAP